MSNRLRQNPNDSQPRPNPDRMNIHRYRVSYLWSSFITNSVGSSTAISHTLRTESVIPGVYRESGRWSALGGEFHRLVCACFVRTICRENSEGWERKRRVGERVIEREREREKERRGRTKGWGRATTCSIEYVSHSVQRARGANLCVQQFNGITRCCIGVRSSMHSLPCAVFTDEKASVFNR